ncbi:MAG: peptide chain release factor N(5)-glutamine methyltransferase [Alphaproteobacteria bacterium]|nr:peptide chain release factor N(5)-glutamine methyltransferase [Alphaproteobacteria bacterium]
MTTLHESLQEITTILAKAKIELPKLEARLITQKILELNLADMISVGSFNIEDHKKILIDQLVRRRIDYEPLAYILEEKEFWSLPFKVDPNVLIPRPDSETIISSVLNSIDDLNYSYKILDLGTGSGCLILSLLKELPCALGVGVDCSNDALKIAAFNAEQNSLQDRVDFILSDWENNLHDTFDLIISNPPYIETNQINNLQTEILLYEPKIALDGGADGLNAYRQILSGMKKILKKDGKLFFEIGSHQSRDVVKLAANMGLLHCQTFYDLAGIARCLVFKWI